MKQYTVMRKFVGMEDNQADALVQWIWMEYAVKTEMAGAVERAMCLSLSGLAWTQQLVGDSIVGWGVIWRRRDVSQWPNILGLALNSSDQLQEGHSMRFWSWFWWSLQYGKDIFISRFSWGGGVVWRRWYVSSWLKNLGVTLNSGDQPPGGSVHDFLAMILVNFVIR